MDELNASFDKCMAAADELKSELAKLDAGVDRLGRSVDAMIRDTIIWAIVTGVGFFVILIIAVRHAT